MSESEPPDPVLTPAEHVTMRERFLLAATFWRVVEPDPKDES